MSSLSWTRIPGGRLPLCFCAAQAVAGGGLASALPRLTDPGRLQRAEHARLGVDAFNPVFSSNHS